MLETQNKPRKILEDLIVYCFYHFPKLSERLVFGKRLAQEEYEGKLDDYTDKHNSYLVATCVMGDNTCPFSKVSLTLTLSDNHMAYLYFLKIMRLQKCASYYGLNIIDEKSRLFELKISSK